MTISRRFLCVVYALIGLAALVGTWGNNVAYLNLGLVGANVHFWQETLVNPASRSITVDILLLSVAVIVWMLLEARRLAMRGVWAYVLVGAFVAISAAFPAFLIHRERALAARDGSRAAGTLSAGDLAGLAILCVVSLAYTFVALRR
jgi:cbb3-type cytochrome oxidase subunit 3